MYTSTGIKLTKIRKVFKFNQSDWLKKFVDFNTEKRKNATNDLEKKFFKLMINSVFGKRMENLRKRIDVKLINNAKDYLKYVSRPTFVSQRIFSKNFAAIHKIKPVLVLNKPSYVGFSILELSKLFMYDLHYKYFKKKFDVRLLLTDTDSLLYEVKGEDDVYEKIYLDKDLIDFSNYPSSSKFYDVTNKEFVFKTKDELGGEVNFEFVGL